MQSAIESAILSPGGARGPRLDRLLVGSHRAAILAKADQYLADFTNVEVFEAGRKVSRRQRMNDGEFQAYLENKRPLLPEEVKVRIIFVPDMANDTDKLQLTTTAYEGLLDRFEICARFSGLVRMQLMPNREMDYSRETMRPTRLQYLYSGIVRSLSQAANPKDPTKRILDWRRVINWTSRDMRTGVTTIVILRCPLDLQERMLRMIGDGGDGHSLLTRFPMLVDAFIAEDLIVRKQQFSEEFAAPMYGLELDLGHTAYQFTQRARRFMLMSRQIGNVLIDYDIYQASLRTLQEIYQIIRMHDPPSYLTKEQWDNIHYEFDGKVFELVHGQLDLLRKYGQLYEERTKIGNAECTALISQREVEIAKQMSAESTVIARSAHQDGQSLRIIQYLGLLFLPLSLCTSVFGMSFFSASETDEGTVLLISDRWWWFLALSIPFTLVVVMFAWISSTWSLKQAEARRRTDSTDLEKMLSFELDEREEDVPP